MNIVRRMDTNSNPYISQILEYYLSDITSFKIFFQRDAHAANLKFKGWK